MEGDAVSIAEKFYTMDYGVAPEDPKEAVNQGMKIWWWDFIFYATFGFVVTSSVKVAGVLLVFAFLIIPAVAAVLATEGTGKRIVFGWVFGLIGCVAGIEASLRLDWSPGPTIVAVFLVLLVITWLTKKFIWPKTECV